MAIPLGSTGARQTLDRIEKERARIEEERAKQRRTDTGNSTSPDTTPPNQNLVQQLSQKNSNSIWSK